MSKEESFTTLPCPLDPDQSDLPWLLLSHGKYNQHHTFYSTSKDIIDTKTIPEFRLKKVVCTSYKSWLASIHVGKVSLDFCLLNTHSKQIIHLPPIALNPGHNNSPHYACILSHPPTNPNCHALFINQFDPLLHFCHVGGDEKNIISRTREFGDDDELSPAVNFGGKVYAWMTRSRTLVEVDFIGGEVIIKKVVNAKGQNCHIPNPLPKSWCAYDEHLVASESQLLLVHLNAHGHDHSGEVSYFHIFEIDTLKGEWSELKSIGDGTVFLDHYGSGSWLCRRAGGSDDFTKKNSIYFWSDRVLCVYDIEDRSKTLVKLPPVKRNSPWLLSWVFM